MSSLKKYFPFTKGVAQESLTYRVRFLFWLGFEILYLVIAYYLWRGVYQSHATSQGIELNSVVIGLYTFSQMTLYVFFEKIVGAVTCLNVHGYMSDDIQEGSIAMNLIKPISYRSLLLAKGCGDLLISLIFFALPFTVILIVCSFIMNLGFQITWYSIIMFVVSIVFGAVINYLVSFLFGSILFLTINSFGMWQLKEAIERILSGSLIPIALFPTWLQIICKAMPFQQTKYVPICFILGQYNDKMLLGVHTLGVQLIWILGLSLLSRIVWKKMVKRVVVQGG